MRKDNASETRKVLQVGGSKAVTIPREWLERVKEATGKDVKEVRIGINRFTLQVIPIIEGVDYYPASWLRDIKARLVEETMGECGKCHRRFKGNGLILHHKRSRSEGGQDILSNLMLVCHKCHTVIHRPDTINGLEARWERIEKDPVKFVDVTAEYLAKLK